MRALGWDLLRVLWIGEISLPAVWMCAGSVRSLRPEAHRTEGSTGSARERTRDRSHVRQVDAKPLHADRDQIAELREGGLAEQFVHDRNGDPHRGAAWRPVARAIRSLQALDGGAESRLRSCGTLPCSIALSSRVGE